MFQRLEKKAFDNFYFSYSDGHYNEMKLGEAFCEHFEVPDEIRDELKDLNGYRALIGIFKHFLVV